MKSKNNDTPTSIIHDDKFITETAFSKFLNLCCTVHSRENKVFQ